MESLLHDLRYYLWNFEASLEALGLLYMEFCKLSEALPISSLAHKWTTQISLQSAMKTSFMSCKFKDFLLKFLCMAGQPTRVSTVDASYSTIMLPLMEKVQFCLAWYQDSSTNYCYAWRQARIIEFQYSFIFPLC